MLISKGVVNSFESRSLEVTSLLDNGELEKAAEKLYVLASNGHVESMKELGLLLVNSTDRFDALGGSEEGMHWLREAAYCHDNEAINAVEQLTGKRTRVYNHFWDQLIYLAVSMLVAFSVVVHYLRTEVNLFGVFFYFFASVWYLGAYLGQRNVFGETSWVCKHIKVKGYGYKDLLLRKSTEYFIKLAMSLLLFVIGAVMIAFGKMQGDLLQIISIMLPVLMTSLVVYTNTLLLIKVTRRSISIEKIHQMMFLVKRLGSRWENIVAILFMTGNLAVFLLCFALVL